MESEWGRRNNIRFSFERILEENAGDLLVQQLECNGGEDSNKSCLGLLTMINDYGAQLGWRFEANPAHPEIQTVTTSAILDLKQLQGAAE